MLEAHRLVLAGDLMAWLYHNDEFREDNREYYLVAFFEAPYSFRYMFILLLALCRSCIWLRLCEISLVDPRLHLAVFLGHPLSDVLQWWSLPR